MTTLFDALVLLRSGGQRADERIFALASCAIRRGRVKRTQTAGTPRSLTYAGSRLGYRGAMVAVVADSASNLPDGLAEELRIEVVPMWLRLGDAEYRDGVDMPSGGVYEWLASSGERASTATPSWVEFQDAFERTGQHDIVCVTVASTMSAARHQARMAAERFDGTVAVVDSLNASMAEGFVALEAARAAMAGATLQDIAERGRWTAERTSLFATVDTFEYLERSGRVSKLQAFVAGKLDINPVFRFHGGEAQPLARPRTRERAIERIVDETRAAIGEGPGHLAVIHASAPGEAHQLADTLAETMNLIECHVVEVTPVIGVHTGPGLLGTASFAG
jgi:DegV family protein with EDD domain